jgi:hypothetical protein
MANDPAKVLDHFADDPRIDVRYRENTLAGMRAQLVDCRSARGRMRALMAFRRKFREPDAVAD